MDPLDQRAADGHDDAIAAYLNPRCDHAVGAHDCARFVRPGIDPRMTEPIDVRAVLRSISPERFAAIQQAVLAGDREGLAALLSA